MNGMNTGIGLVITIVLAVIAILWILLPFSVFGIKDLLQELINEAKKTNELLEKITPEQKKILNTNQEKNIHEDIILGG